MSGPLDGVRVLELGQVIAGTFAGMLMADLGAEVIKVEAPRGDLGRNPHIAHLRGESALFLAFNRGKKSTVVDLKSEGGLGVFYDLVKKADVVVDNFRPGVLERMRIDHETLSGHNPRVVTCSITGFGRQGPQRDLPSFDLIHQAMSGLLSVTGPREGPPARVGIALADIGTPMFALHGILAALVNRQRTGRGSRVDVSMFESMVFLHTYDAVLYLNGGEQPRAWGTGHAHHVPWQAFATRDGQVVVATREEAFWVNFCDAVGAPQLASDPRFATNLDRIAHRQELIPILEARMRERTTADWLQIFSSRQVPAAPVNDLAHALREPALAENGGIVEVPYEPLGGLRMLADPIRASGAETSYGPPPRLGEHTREVLAGVAGYSQQTIAGLESEGAVWDAATGRVPA